MNRLLICMVLLALSLTPVCAAPNTPTTALPKVQATNRLPGADLAEGVTQLTGVAISPLLGVSAVGAWKYYQAPAAQRARLPWFCQPYIWGVGFFLIGLCFLKDLFGTVAPALIKKPLDVAELFESKLSALVASSAFVPFIVSQMAQYSPSAQASLAVSANLPCASVLAASGFDIRLIGIPLGIAGFLLVWLSSHAINVLIALCPFGLIDGMLKLFKAMLLFSVVASSLINPYLGAAFALGLLFIAGLLAPWAFRLSVFGMVFGLDLLLPGRARQAVRATEPHAFLARAIAKAPVRSYGRLTRQATGCLSFSYRPWLILPERSVTLPPGKISITRGLLFPTLVHGAEPQQRQSSAVIFLPRYRSHEQSIAACFEISEIQDGSLLKGFNAVRAWLSETLHLAKPKYTRA